jgi:DNA-binding GntR family transcriptional regulator
MADQIDRWNPQPVYQQLAAILRGQINRGELVSRQPLPSEAQLVGEYGVSRGTARRAVEVLRDEGLVVTVPQRGSYVTEVKER